MARVTAEAGRPPPGYEEARNIGPACVTLEMTQGRPVPTVDQCWSPIGSGIDIRESPEPPESAATACADYVAGHVAVKKLAMTSPGSQSLALNPGVAAKPASR